MKPVRTHDAEPVSTSVDATDPVEPPTEGTEGTADQAPSQTASGSNDENTNPDPVDVERLMLSFDRPPRPPAPLPDERASSDGGRFVAYGATGRPAQPQTTEDVRRRALAELSVLVNVTPVPPEGLNGDTSTAPATPKARRRPRGVWRMAGAVAVALGVLGALVAWSRSHETRQPTPAAPIVSAAATAVLVAPTARIETTPHAQDREPVTIPSGTQEPAHARTRGHGNSETPPTAQPKQASPPAAASTAVSHPKKPVFGYW